MLDGQPYKYFFARKNRNPALHYIENIEIPQNIPIDKALIKSLANFRAYDPDEDEVSNDNSYSIDPDPSDPKTSHYLRR